MRGESMSWAWSGLRAWIVILGLASCARAADAVAAFEQANKLYEQGRFTEAADAYSALAQSNRLSPSLLFNLGNAHFKSGQIGRAILAYRRAERLAPRDPDVRANLQFARNQLSGGAAPPGGWARWLERFRLDEWTLMGCAALWIWLLLLAAGEVRPAWKRSLRPAAVAAGGAALLLGLMLAVAWHRETRLVPAVVVAREAVVRYGPVEESQSAFSLADGAEVRVLDAERDWLQVMDGRKRTGWIKRATVEMVTPGRESKPRS
jgi:tetratricopeptide (TPR) repeat protein